MEIDSPIPLLPSQVPPLKSFGLYTLILCLCFCVPLYGWMWLGLRSELYSHILLVPFITAYLIRLKLREYPSGRNGELEIENQKSKIKNNPPSSVLLPSFSDLCPLTSVFCLLSSVLGAAFLTTYLFLCWRGWNLNREDSICLTTLSFVFFLLAGGFRFLGVNFMKSVAFPVVILFFMVPFPTFVKNGIEFFFQHTSAEAAWRLLSVSGPPVFREGLVFHLPGISFRVAEECSGIRSSLVLFITGMLAANLFLHSAWRRAVLALFVIPLGIVRNGFRIFTIGMLCVHVSPDMIDSPLHHRGGPIFFALSLIPFFLILWWLRRSEYRAQRAKTTGPLSTGN